MTTAEKAEAFALQVLADTEQARRRHRHRGGLEGEVHEVHTDYRPGGIQQFLCKHCRRWTVLGGRVVPTYTLLECSFCGDFTRVIFHDAPGV